MGLDKEPSLKNHQVENFQNHKQRKTEKPKSETAPECDIVSGTGPNEEKKSSLVVAHFSFDGHVSQVP